MANDQACSGMQLELSNGQESIADVGLPSGKTCRELSAQTKAETLLKFSSCLLALTSTHPKGGATLELHSARKGLLNGGYVMLNSTEYPNAVVESSLLQILETGPVDTRYYLSPRACQGILRRAEKRGKRLPQQLAETLTAQAQVSPEL